MKNTKALRKEWLLFLVVGCLWCSSPHMEGQTTTINSAPQGEKAVWSNSSTIAGSLSAIDASAFCTSAAGSACSGATNNPPGVDFCIVLHYALTHLPSTVSSVGVVVDARGIVPGGHGPQKCTIDPFNAVTYSGSITVLLPATTLEMNHEWLLPSNTRIVGQGAGTTLQPQTSQWNGYADNSNAIIEMGATAGSTGVVIEHLGPM
jgi:hypothetical protein